MTRCSPAEMFETISREYDAQDFAAIAWHYDLPGALYLEDEVVVWSNQSSLIKFLKQHCACNYQLGARSARAKVVAQSLQTEQHFSVWVDWEHLDQNGAIMFHTQARYFCRTGKDGHPLIQLVEIPERPSCYNSFRIAPPFRHPRMRIERRPDESQQVPVRFNMAWRYP